MDYELITVTYQWNDDVTKEYSGVICIGATERLEDYDDDEILFYVEDRDELALLTYPDNGEDFVIIAIDEE